MTTTQNTTQLKRTPLFDKHVALGAKIVPFAGYELPIYYTSIMEEHRWVREACGIFDVSHLGEVKVTGRNAFPFLQGMVPTDLRKIGDGQIAYTVVLNNNGCIIDDILIYRQNLQSFYLVVNASRIAKICAHFKKHAMEHVTIEDQSDDCACVAIQGPKSAAIVEKLFGKQPIKLAYYSFAPMPDWGKTVWISRTGYTGEDGFEIFADAVNINRAWDLLMSKKDRYGIRPVGLGARNTLRLEAGNVLNGTDMDETKTPYEARLSWVVSPDKGPFVGSKTLFERKVKGFRHKLAGFKLKDRAVAREGYGIYKENKQIGIVTSGSYSPTLNINIGLGYLETPHTNVGTEIEIEIHGKKVKAEVAKLPFVPLKHL